MAPPSRFGHDIANAGCPIPIASPAAPGSEHKSSAFSLLRLANRAGNGLLSVPILMKPKFQEYLRTLLLLGRVSNLPTVWSNCLAGWMLGGGGPNSDLVLLIGAATAMYIGGMFLNDAMDVNFDQQHRPERPIPSGRISLGEVWIYGMGLLVGGVLVFGLFSRTSLILSIYLFTSILIYDLVHKALIISPLLMAMCRVFLFLVAASVGATGISGLTLWMSIALGLYVVGLSYVAKSESNGGALRYWPCLALLAPVGLGVLVNKGEYRPAGNVLAVVVLLWVARSLYFTFWAPRKNIGQTVSLLLAGITLVDLLALGGGSFPTPVVFGGLFVLALLFQKLIPAT